MVLITVLVILNSVYELFLLFFCCGWDAGEVHLDRVKLFGPMPFLCSVSIHSYNIYKFCYVYIKLSIIKLSIWVIKLFLCVCF